MKMQRPCGNYILFEVILILAVTYQAKGDLSRLVDHCCTLGSDWASVDAHCLDYNKPIVGIQQHEREFCTSILNVCCIKSRQMLMCKQGKSAAYKIDPFSPRGRGRSACRAPPNQLAGATYEECCDCCLMGNMSRAMGMECIEPGIGDPCDLTFFECCTGIKDNPEPSKSNDTATDVSDMDECELFGDDICGPNARCVNVPGSYRCDCNHGYIQATDGISCIEADEVPTCAEHNPCDHNCVDSPLGPLCDCEEGWRLRSNGRNCQDIDECAEGTHNCGDNEECQNEEGTYLCALITQGACPIGFKLDKRTGGCVEDTGPKKCPQGYAFNTVSQRCEDINECSVGLHNCDPTSEVCQNRLGSFDCICEDGFRRASRRSKCQDIDECARRMDTCTSSQRCENTVGSYACRRLTPCGTGWTLNEDTQDCVDQNECELGTHNCGVSYECFNIEGSFRCNPRQCPSGYRFDSSTRQCKQVNCPRGLRPDPKNSLCVDINECTERQQACKSYQQCLNSYGSFRCLDPRDCGPGYELDENGRQCIDIDECKLGTHNCESDQMCENRRGSFRCSCPPGFKRVGRQCVDKDECQYGLCPFNSRCENTVGSYKCTCNPGLERKGQECIDIDECQTPNRCQHRCINMPGTFHCACNIGYKLAADKRTCEDIDECKQFGTRGRLCGGQCINTQGSYQCTCPAGWRVLGNGRSCQDINECEDGTDSCEGDDVMCFNTRGSHKCPRIVCPPGFERSSLGPRRNSVRCKRQSFTCREGDEECLNAPLSLSYNFLSFPINVKVPTDLFSMSGPRTQQKQFDWFLNVTSVHPLKAGVQPVQRDDFNLKIGRTDAVVSLQNRINGPQDIQLKLTMKITDRYTRYSGYAHSFINLYVTSNTIG